MPDTSLPKVTVTVCTWNRAALLKQTLEQMTRLLVPAGLGWELLIVNNGSTDNTAAVAAGFMGRLPLRVVDEPLPGLSHARNRALVEGRADLLLFTDDDVLVEPGWLAAFIGAASRHPGIAAFGGPIDPWFPERIDPAIVEAFPIVANGFCGLNHGGDERRLDPGEEIYGACMGFRRSLLGGLTFDPSLGALGTSARVGEETDFLARLCAAGGQAVWVPAMRLRHYVDPRRTTLRYLERYHDQKGQLWVRNLGIQDDAALFLGAPRWLWRKAAAALIKSYARTASLQRVPALVERRRYWWLKGMIKECRRTPPDVLFVSRRGDTGSPVWANQRTRGSTPATHH
jgi:glycosyltransferase involved in cell wall biosynthesis